MEPKPEKLLQIGADQVDEVFGQLGGDLLLGAVGQMEADMRLQNLAHEAVDASTDGGEEHELSAAILVGSEGALDGVELSAEFSDPLQ